jgi:hypothetical protein
MCAILWTMSALASNSALIGPGNKNCLGDPWHQMELINEMRNARSKIGYREAFPFLTARGRTSIFPGSIVTTRSRELYGEIEG